MLLLFSNFLRKKKIPIFPIFIIRGSKFLKLENTIIIQIPINNDLVTTGQMLHGGALMTRMTTTEQ
jgi:hypothetical protein